MRKIFTYLSLVVGLLFFRAAYGQVNYPSPIGHVNDFANLLNPQDKQELERKLRDYRDKTSIEVAVVTVPSLEGLTVEEYTLNLATKWGVGDKEKDNGIVMLVAPNEREMRIEVGYGMEPDLTDAQAGRIIENYIIPQLKEQKMTAGIVAGIDAILSELGSTPFETRLEERRIAEEKRQADAKRQAEESAVFMKFVGIFLVLGFLVSIPLMLIYKNIRRTRKLNQQFQDNHEALRQCERLLQAAEDNYPDAQKNLEELKINNPKKVWSDLENSVN